MTPSTLYRATTAANIQASGKPRPRWPLQGRGNSAPFLAYAFDQDFQCALASVFPPPNLNTPSNSGTTFIGLADGNAILTKVSNPQNAGDGQVKFTGSFARVPASWDEFKTQGVTFPGWLDTTAGSGARTALSLNVNIRLHYDYFLVDPGAIAAGATNSGGGAITAVSDMGKIPSNLRTIFLTQGGSYPIPGSQAKDLSNGVTVGDTFWQVTYPSVAQYQTMMTNAASVLAGSASWTETAPPQCVIVGGASPSNNFSTAGQYRFADSSLRVYEGNIIERCSYYVLPQ